MTWRPRQESRARQQIVRRTGDSNPIRRATPDSRLSNARGTSPLHPPCPQGMGRQNLSPVDARSSSGYSRRTVVKRSGGSSLARKRGALGRVFGFRDRTGSVNARSQLAELGAVVELLDVHGARRGGFDAELAEDALVEVLLHRLDSATGVLVDVDGADFLELGGEGRVAGDGVVDLDVDEDLVQLLGHQAAAPSFCLTASGISSIRSTTRIPAASRRAIFSVAVSSTPSTMVPACPKLIPFISSSSMNLPAMKATIGRRLAWSATHSESWASMRPPGSV